MEVTTTSNQELTFNCRNTTASDFSVKYISESTNVETTINVSGSYANGKVTFSLNLDLDSDTFYMFYISDEVREICRHKVYVTNQSVNSYKLDDGIYTKVDSTDDSYIIYE